MKVKKAVSGGGPTPSFVSRLRSIPGTVVRARRADILFLAESQKFEGPDPYSGSSSYSTAWPLPSRSTTLSGIPSAPSPGAMSWGGVHRTSLSVVYIHSSWFRMVFRLRFVVVGQTDAAGERSRGAKAVGGT